MTKEDFERRVSLAVQYVESLSILGIGVENATGETGMTPAEALAFYEEVIELLDNRLEDMMGEWKEPESSKRPGLG